MTTAGGGHRKRKTVKRGLEDFCGARPELFVRTGKGWLRMQCCMGLSFEERFGNVAKK